MDRFSNESQIDNLRFGNAMIHNRQWQRKPGNDGDIRGLINELISETSSNIEQNSNGQFNLEYKEIEVGVKNNKLHAEMDDYDFDELNEELSNSSSEKQIISTT